MTGTKWSVGLASCTCGHAWWAVNECGDNVVRLSGMECDRCGGLTASYVAKPAECATLDEALTEVVRMREEVMP